MLGNLLQINLPSLAESASFTACGSTVADPSLLHSKHRRENQTNGASLLQNTNLSLCGKSRDNSIIVFIYRSTTPLVSR